MDQIIGALQEALNIPEGEIAEALKDGEELKSKAEISKFLKKVVQEKTDKAFNKGRDEGHGRGFKESLTAKEKELREKYEVDGSSLDEIVEAIQQKAVAQSTAAPEDVRNSEIFIEETKKLKDKLKALKEEKDQIETTYRKKEIYSKVKEKGLSLLQENNFDLPDENDPRRSNLMKSLINSLESDGAKLEINDKGGIVVLDEHGKAYQDKETYDTVTFDEYFEQKAKLFFPVKAGDGRQSPANKEPGGEGGGKKFSFPQFKSVDEAFEYAQSLDPKEIDKRKAFSEQVLKPLEKAAK